MMRHRVVRSLFAASVLAGTSMVAAGTAPATAECAMQAPPRWIAGYRGMAFIGTVTASDTVRLTSGEYAVLTIDVERSIAGDPPDPVRVLGGPRRTSCTHFRAGAFRVGDRLLLSFKPFDEVFAGRPEGVEVAWVALPWVPRPDGGWRFARRGVTFPDSYPIAAVRARTLARIVTLIRPRRQPETGASDPVGSTALAAVPLLGDVTSAISGLVERDPGARAARRPELDASDAPADPA